MPTRFLSKRPAKLNGFVDSNMKKGMATTPGAIQQGKAATNGTTPIARPPASSCPPHEPRFRNAAFRLQNHRHCNALQPEGCVPIANPVHGHNARQEAVEAIHEPGSAGVPPASSPSVSLGAVQAARRRQNSPPRTAALPAIWFQVGMCGTMAKEALHELERRLSSRPDARRLESRHSHVRDPLCDTIPLRSFQAGLD